MTYTQLAQEGRYQIYVYLKAGHNQTDFVMILNSHNLNISREIQRHIGLRGYRLQNAQCLTHECGQSKAQPRVPDISWSNITHLLRQEWRPEQTSLWLKFEEGVIVSRESFYQSVLRAKAFVIGLYHHLRCQKQRRKFLGSHNLRDQLVDQISVDERSAIVDVLTGICGLEINNIIGKAPKIANCSLDGEDLKQSRGSKLAM